MSVNGGPERGLVLRVSVAHEESSTEDPRDAILELDNFGPRPVVTCLRLLVNQCSSPVEVRDVCFEIEGPPGYVNTCLFSVRAGPAGIGDYGVLAPGRPHRAQRKLTQYESLDSPGEYVLTAKYLSLGRMNSGD